MTIETEDARMQREQAEHVERDRFRGRSCALILEWDERGSVTVRHGGGVGSTVDDAIARAFCDAATPPNTVQMAQAIVSEAIAEYAFGRWARGQR
jgi:hypothetical protein